MIIWRTANLITRAFTSEATQDWLTGTTCTLSSDRDTYKSQGSATMETSCESSKPSIPETLNSDTSLGTATLQRCRSGEIGSGNDAAKHVFSYSSHGSALHRTVQDPERPSSSTTGIVTPHGRGDRAEKGTLSIAIDSNSASTVIIHDIKVKRESPKPLLHNVMDEQPFLGSTQGVTPLYRTLRAKRGFRPANAHNGVFGTVSMNPFEPEAESRLHPGDAPTLPGIQKTKVDLFPKEELSGGLSDCQLQASLPAALHNGAPLYFHKMTASNGNGNPMNATDHAGSYLQLDDDMTARHKPGSDLYALRESPEMETSGIPQEKPRDVIAELEKEPMNGLPTGHEMDTSPDVVDRKNTRKYPNTEMNEAATLPKGVPGTTPANGCSDVKESAPSTKDSADVSNQTSPRKITLKDKIRGEMKVLTGKLGNKIAAAKKVMSKVV